MVPFCGITAEHCRGRRIRRQISLFFSQKKSHYQVWLILSVKAKTSLYFKIQSCNVYVADKCPMSFYIPK